MLGPNSQVKNQVQWDSSNLPTKNRSLVRQLINDEYDYRPPGRMTPQETVDALLEASRLPISLSNIYINPKMSLDEKGPGLTSYHGYDFTYDRGKRPNF